MFSVLSIAVLPLLFSCEQGPSTTVVQTGCRFEVVDLTSADDRSAVGFSALDALADLEESDYQAAWVDTASFFELLGTLNIDLRLFDGENIEVVEMDPDLCLFGGPALRMIVGLDVTNDDGTFAFSTIQELMVGMPGVLHAMDLQRSESDPESIQLPQDIRMAAQREAEDQGWPSYTVHAELFTDGATQVEEKGLLMILTLASSDTAPGEIGSLSIARSRVRMME